MGRTIVWAGPRGFGVIHEGPIDAVVAMSDRARWSAVRTRRPNAVIAKWSEKARLSGRSADELHVVFTALLSWAERATRDVPADTIIRGPAKHPPDVTVLKLTRDAGSGFVIYRKLPKSSAHKIGALHAEVCRRIATARRVWKWTPTDLEVTFMPDTHAMGKALIALPINLRMPQRITLSELLMARYELSSVGRTVIHELCHHYREGRFPRPRKTWDTADWHDKTFCREIGRADPVVRKQPVSCAKFTDIASPPKGREPVWEPAAGRLVIKIDSSGSRMTWKPTRGGAWPLDERYFADLEMLHFIKHFRGDEWKKVQIVYTAKTLPQRRLDALVKALGPSKIPQTLAHLASRRRAAKRVRRGTS